MDRAEAITYWEGLHKTFSSQLEKEENHFGRMHLQYTLDVLDTTIAALREQEQRGQGCEYCDGTDMDLYFREGAYSPMNDHVYISENRIECDFGGKAWGAFGIKFCPMCGRKLPEPPKEGADQ